MKKIIHITLLFFFAFLAFPAQAQNPVMSDYWKDFDFSDTTLISSNTMSDKLINFFYSFTDGDERRFDSLSISGLDFVLDKAKVNMQMYEYILGFALKGYSAMGRDQVTDYLLNDPQLVEGETTVQPRFRLAHQVIVSAPSALLPIPDTTASHAVHLMELPVGTVMSKQEKQL